MSSLSDRDTFAETYVKNDDKATGSPANREPVAWAVTMGDGSVYEAFAAHQYDEAVALARKCLFGSDLPLPLEPLYRQPTLTDVARESLAAMACYFDSRSDLQMQAWGSLLRGLLERAK